jgi:hypothetical protein
VPLGQGGNAPWGLGTFDDVTGAQARQIDVTRDTYRARGLFARLRQDRVCHLCLERLTLCQCFLGPLQWASLTNVHGAVFYYLLGTLGILIPDWYHLLLLSSSLLLI